VIDSWFVEDAFSSARETEWNTATARLMERIFVNPGFIISLFLISRTPLFNGKTRMKQARQRGKWVEAPAITPQLPIVGLRGGEP
jgi:hypothetical protein